MARITLLVEDRLRELRVNPELSDAPLPAYEALLEKLKRCF
jgi:hypothetical protein